MSHNRWFRDLPQKSPFMCDWQVLAHVKEKHHQEKLKCAELQATLAKAQEQLQTDKERARSVVKQRLKRKTRQMKLQEAKLLQEPTLMAQSQVYWFICKLLAHSHASCRSVKSVNHVIHFLRWTLQELLIVREQWTSRVASLREQHAATIRAL